MNDTVTILGAFAGMLASFFAILKYTLTQSSKDREADRSERKEVVKAFNRVAEATERAAKEAKERNGHLAEMEAQGQKMLEKVGNRNYELSQRVLETVTNMNVENQFVHAQTINEEVVQKRSSA
jgi:hypothetical protein